MAVYTVHLLMIVCYCLSTLLTLGARLPPTLNAVRKPHHNKTTSVSRHLTTADQSTSNGQSVYRYILLPQIFYRPLRFAEDRMKDSVRMRP